jgi:hypothetical protein
MCILKLALLCIEDWAFSKKSRLIIVFLFAFTYLSVFLRLIPKNTKNTLKLLLLFCKMCEPIPLASYGFDKLFFLKGTIIYPLHLWVIGCH